MMRPALNCYIPILHNTQNKDTQNKDKIIPKIRTQQFCVPTLRGIGAQDTTMLCPYLVLSKLLDSNQMGIAIQATANSKATTAN